LLKYLIVFAVLALVLPAQADVLWNQPTAAGANAVSSQDYITWSCRGFDDFTAGALGWTVNKVTVYGYEMGSGGTPKLAFTTSANNTAIGTTYTGTEVGAGSAADFVFDLPDVYVAPGDWWITSWIVRPDPEGTMNQWFWDYITPVTGSEAYWQLSGSSPVPLGSSLYTYPKDLAFKIEGTLGQPVVPEAGALVLAISGIPAVAFFIRRRK